MKSRTVRLIFHSKKGVTPTNNAFLADRAIIGQPLLITLEGRNQISWQIEYMGDVVDLTPETTSYQIDRVNANGTVATVRAQGVDENGFVISVEVELPLDYVDATAINFTQEPEAFPSSVPHDTKVMMSVDTTGASAVMIGDKPMTSLNPPEMSNENTWTYVHTTTTSEFLPVTITTPGNPAKTVLVGTFQLSVFGPPPMNVDRSYIEGVAEIGGSVLIYLDADNHLSMEVVYNGKTFSIDGNQTSHLTDVLLGQADNAGPFLDNELVNAQNFSGIAFDSFDTQTADDFSVPDNETWLISEVTIGGAGADTDLTAADISFHAADNGNLPGSLIAEFYQLPALDDGSGNLTVALSDPLILPAGSYWISFAGVLNFYDGGQWFATTHDREHGESYAWKNSGGGWKIENTHDWVPGHEVLNTPQLDLNFSITGRSVFLLTDIVANAPTATIRALGFDFDGTSAVDEIILNLDFVDAIANNLTQTPNSQPNGIAFETEIILSMDTIGASVVIVDGVNMVSEFNPNTTKINSWTLTHTALETQSLIAEITTPGNPVSVEVAGTYDIFLFGPAPNNVERSFIDGVATIGGSVDIHLDADHQQSWQVVYNEHVYEITGRTEIFILNTVANDATVTIRALGQDRFGRPAMDEVTVNLDFVQADCQNVTQSPNTQPDGFAFGELIELSLETTGASAVTADGIPMVPENEPNTSNLNSWSLTHMATRSKDLDISITTPGNPLEISECASISIQLHGPEIFGPAEIGGAVTIELNPGDQESWDILYNQSMTSISGDSTSYLLENIVADQPTVTLRGHRLDSNNNPFTEDIILAIPFISAAAFDLVQSPNSLPDGVPISTSITLSFNTTGASEVRINNQSLVPENDPKIHHSNSWTTVHNATQNEVLEVFITTPGVSPTEAAAGEFEIRIANSIPNLKINNGLILCREDQKLITGQELQVIDDEATAVEIIYTLVNIPNHGRLSNQGLLLENGDQFSQDDINKRRLRYEHDGGEEEADQFSFTLAFEAENNLIESTFAIVIVDKHYQVFVEQTGSGNPLFGKDTGILTHPVFVDIDGDGDQDCFVGNGEDQNGYFENTGTRTEANYIKRTGEDDPFHLILDQKYTAPTFVDIDGDGDLDCFVGDKNGQNDFYKNEGTAMVPFFVLPKNKVNPLLGLNTGKLSPPVFADLDGDTDLDVFLGREKGTIEYFENIGTTSAPEFTKKTGDRNPFEGLDFGEGISPTFIDIDCDDDLDVFMGSVDGTILYYENTGTPTEPDFEQRFGAQNPLDHIDVGEFSAPYFVDIDYDGDPDCFIGNDSETVRFFENMPGNIAPTDIILTQATISENLPIDTPVGEFQVVDENGNDSHQYTLVNGDGDSDNNNFSIDGSTLKSAIEFNFEAQTKYNIRVLVIDGDNGNFEKSFIITILNVNEAPAFTSLPNLTVSDTVDNGLVIGKIEANDEDIGDEYQFTINEGNVDGVFSLNPVSGQLSVANNNSLSFVSIPRYFLTVEVSDTELSDIDILIVDITSDNEHIPTILPQEFEVSENAKNTTIVGEVIATDNDGDSTSFTIEGGNEDGVFTIDGVNGELTVMNNTNLDYTRQTQYILRVSASDGRYSASTEVTVNVINENVNAPELASQSFSVAEHSENGTTVGTVVATDPEGGPLAYAIVDGNGNNVFAFAPESSVLTVADNSNLDFGIAPNYSLIVEVTDGRYTVAAVVRINVTSDNINAPKIESQQFTVAEDSENGTLVGVIMATDADDSELDFTILSGDTNNVFSITDATGELKVADKSTLDFGIKPTYTLSVQVDDGRYTASTDVIVNVTSDNENPPELSSQIFTIAENTPEGTHIGNVLATDPDDNPLEYKILDGNDGKIFTIDLNSGEIVLKKATLDFESKNVYHLTIEVGDGRYVVSAIVTIRIENSNDSQPNIIDQIWRISEQTEPETKIGKVIGTDPDGDPLQFSISGGNVDNSFTINEKTGNVSLSANAVLDYNTIPEYNVTVAANDGIHTATGTVTILINSIPVVDDQQFSIVETAPNNMLVGVVLVEDPDGDSTNFEIKDGNQDNVFNIDTASGAITVGDNTNLDYEKTPQYMLIIEVGDGVHTVNGTITIDVIDVNDSGPGFGIQIFEFDVSENAPQDTFVGEITASDPENDTLTFTVINADPIFDQAFNFNNGLITVDDPQFVDYELVTVVNLIVKADDGIPYRFRSGSDQYHG